MQVETPVNLGIESERHNLPSGALYEEAVRNGEGMIAADGSLVVSTGQYTGRSPKDKFVVEEPSSKDKVWWGNVNQPISEDHFNGLRDRIMDYLYGKKLYVQYVCVRAEPEYRLCVRVFT